MYITICSWCGAEYKAKRLRTRGFCKPNCRLQSNRLERRALHLAEELRKAQARLNEHHAPGRRPATYTWEDVEALRKAT